MDNSLHTQAFPLDKVVWLGQNLTMDRVGDNSLIKRLAKELAPARPSDLKLSERAAEIAMRPATDKDKAFLTRFLVQCTFPHSNPGNVPAWFRQNGNITLSIKPGTDQAGKTIGYPYGSIPRLLLYWITTEVLRTGQRKIELGPRLSEFMEKLGLDPSRGGPRSDAKRLREQMLRLFKSTISITQTTDDERRSGFAWCDMQVAPRGEMWWDPKSPDQGVFWNSWIEVTELFFDAVRRSPVPMDLRVLKALKRSPLALDLYALCNYLGATLDRPHFIAWKMLQFQLGSDTTNERTFRRNVLAAMRKVKSVQPQLNVVQVKGGISIAPSRPSISRRPPASRVTKSSPENQTSEFSKY